MSSHFFKVKNGISFPPQTSYPTDPQDKDIIYRGDLNQLMIYTGGAWTNMLAMGSGGGITKVTLVNSTATTLPAGANATIDNVAVANDNLVLFTNLSSGNNQVYKVSGVGTALVWTAQSIFSNSTTPTVGDFLYVTAGDAYSATFLSFTTAWGPVSPFESFITLGENVTANDIVYTSVGNTFGDTGRNAGMVYRIDPTNQYRARPSGFVKKAQNSGNLAKVFTGGLMTGVATSGGLAVGKTIYAQAYNQLVYAPATPSTFPTFLIPIGTMVKSGQVQFQLPIKLTLHPTFTFNLTPSNTAVTIGTYSAVNPFANFGGFLSAGCGKFDYFISIVDTTAAVRKQMGTFTYYNANTTPVWEQEYHGEDCGVTLGMTSSAQLTNIALTTVVSSGTITFWPAGTQNPLNS